KQFLELNTFYFKDRKTGKNRSVGGIILFVLIFAFLFLSIAMMFLGMADALCEPLAAMNMQWLYFAIFGIMSIAIGTFGSVFNTYASLYRSKDNDLLLSMPIPPSKILLVRMLGVYAMSLLYSAIVWLPAVFRYCAGGHASVNSIIFSVLLTFINAALVTVLTCILGWVVALISSKLKNKSFVTVALSLLFLAAYYFVYFRLNSILSQMLENSERVGAALKWVYPVYQMGRGAAGEILPMIIYVLIVAIAFMMCCAILSRSFIGIATMGSTVKKTKYKEGRFVVKSADSALLRKELKRFTSSPTYMLNTGLGIVILIAAAVFAVIRADTLREVISQIPQMMPPLANCVPVFFATALLLALSMNYISSPSVSLEGRNIWIVQSSPVMPWKALKAKLRLHIFINIIPAAVCAAVFGFVATDDLPTVASMVLLAVVYVCFTGALGLMIDLLKPNLSWTNEAIPIKQGVSAFVTLFGGWAIAVLLSAGAVFLRITPWLYMLLFGVLLAAATYLMVLWIKKSGSKIFAALQ
ncbi:MAG: hypothetical protein IJL87_09000, partial [Clostridia bacterium]|nr:hypothetical protein [Clostridia bacterium]